jgi:hypothetical protein
MEPCKTGVMSAMMSGSESAGDVSCGSDSAADISWQHSRSSFDCGRDAILTAASAACHNRQLSPPSDSFRK